MDIPIEEDYLHEQGERVLATWFDQFADPYAWRIEDYDRYVEFACGDKYPAPPPHRRIWYALPCA